MASAEEDLEAIFQMSLDMICIADINTATFLKINPAFSRILGYSEKELLQKSFLDFIHPQDVAPTRQVIDEQLKRGHKVFDFVNRYRRKDGLYRWLRWVSHPVPEKGITYAVAHDITDEINCHTELAESEKRSRLMVDFTHSWEYWIGAHKELIYVSPSCQKYTGYTQDAFMSNADLLLQIVHPEDRQMLIDHLEHESEEPSVATLEFRIIDSSNNVRWISHTCQPVYDDENTFLGRRASNREITEQKKAESENVQLTNTLRETTDVLNTVLDAIPDVIGLQDRNHTIIQYNRAGYRFLQMPPDDVIGKKCYELIGKTAPCHICATSKAYASKTNERVVKYVDELDKWFDARAYPILNENGQVFQVIEHLRDITKEKKAENKLKETHEILITILDSIEAHLYVVDTESFEILFMNQKMKDDFNSDLVGSRCYDSLYGAKAPCHCCLNPSAGSGDLNRNGIHIWEDFNPVINGWYTHYSRIIKWVDGRMVKLQVNTDITQTKIYEKERRRMERQLQQSQKFEAIGTLAGGIAHDFNNLLMGIQGRASLISMGFGPPHEVREHVEAIEAYVRSASDLTKQLLGLARGGKYEVQPVDLNGLLANSATMFGRTKKEIQIHIKLAPDSLVAEVDHRQIEQVLLNMYVNAWQAMPEGGQLFLETASVRLDDKYCQPYQIHPGRFGKLSITDTGVGMDPDTQQRIFDPFFTTKEKSRGTGLGLASAYGIVANHGGIITVNSESGAGANFDIYLPLSDKPVNREFSHQERLYRGTETILLVDDESMIIDVGKKMLEELGYHLLTAKGGLEAIEMIKRRVKMVDLIILDMIMPDMDGSTTFQGICDLQPHLPILLSSGYAMNPQAS